jgi:hypothetical protein
MSPCAVEAASEVPAEEVLEPQNGFAATVEAVEVDGLVAGAALLELEPLPLEPQPASAAVSARIAAVARTERRC